MIITEEVYKLLRAARFSLQCFEEDEDIDFLYDAIGALTEIAEVIDPPVSDEAPDVS